jgi:hypothetical protein
LGIVLSKNVNGDDPKPLDPIERLLLFSLAQRTHGHQIAGGEVTHCPNRDASASPDPHSGEYAAVDEPVAKRSAYAEKPSGLGNPLKTVGHDFIVGQNVHGIPPAYVGVSR